jgi:hypothetical protein
MRILVTNWREILRKAWSIRLILLAGVLTGIEALLPLVMQIPYLKLVTFVVIMSAFVARLLAQKSIKE